ncbi:uncharacterized protein LOC111708693 [Eurytemora carolleeae]|uniref:uncharacterized protein LOC111708693 n=1 Tax=Eurytemora carolleeae TaxID=1294199 RepID=UPI000C77B68C|nr:uncharacterized protein LOC111708693 [Eurytemora carolleeae]|eukprot:XP_023337906.1 uncharacterized protein LOC111708693 [Eurytemora affinis]
MSEGKNWVFLITEQHRYQGLSYKSDIIVISGLDAGDRQALEQKYNGFDPPCLLDSSDGRFVLKGNSYNHIDVMNSLISRRGYSIEYNPQQRNIPSLQSKDDKFSMMYHLSKPIRLRRQETVASFGSSSMLDEPDLAKKTEEMKLK